MPADIFDEQRRAWIAARAGVFLFQKRRAELLAKQIRARTRSKVGARPDPHDDNVTPPLPLRPPGTASGTMENVLVLVCAAAAPVGWPVGRLGYQLVKTLIPERLRAYPIPALMWSAALAALPLIFYSPSPGLDSELITPWLLAQIPATLLTASIYGVLEGWLAVEGSSHWWPLTPQAPDVDDNLLLGPTQLPMPTLLDPAPEPPPARRLPPSLHVRRATPPPIKWAPLLIGAAINAAIALWCLIAALSALLGPADQHFQPEPTDVTAVASHRS
jgi:hypothetical protein